MCIARGPKETGWIGWTGGWPIRRDDLPPAKHETVTEEALEEAAIVDNAANGNNNDMRR